MGASTIEVGESAQDLPLAAHAERWPFDYSGEERRDLGAMLEPHYLDPDGRLYEWMRPFFSQAARPEHERAADVAGRREKDDPTNAIFRSANLIRVAFARDPELAAPLSGSWLGAVSDYVGMDVKVSVRRA